MPNLSPPLRVRRARVDESEAITRVLADVAREGRWILTEAPVDIAARARQIEDAMGTGTSAFWVLVASSGVVGNLGPHRSMAAGVADVGMAILRDYRHQGGGQALLQVAIEHAMSMDLHKIELEVFTDNAHAIALYSRLGFMVEGVRQRHYRRADGTLKDALVMALLLDAARR